MTRLPAICGAAAAAAAAALCAGLLARADPTRLQQALAGGDLLAVLLGDARKDLAGAMVREADVYFHGGVSDIHDLHHHHEHGEGETCEECQAAKNEHDEDGDDHDEHEDEHEEDEHEPHGPDPWRWIDAGIRAPEVHTHLDGERSVELMPWFWAAARADPHNVEAWGSAFHVALRMLKDEELALRIAEEGRRLNPSSIELADTLGQAYCAESVRDDAKAEEAFRAAVELVRGREALNEGEYVAFFDAVSHLAESARDRKDVPALAALLETARRVAPDHQTVLFVSRELDALRAESVAEPADALR